MKARTDTREKIIELGRNLIQTVGYPSLSYQQISSKLGIKNAAVHYHYPTKEDLGVDVIRNDKENFERFTSAMAGLSPWEKLETFLEGYQQALDNGNQICMIGASASDYAELPKSMQNVAAEYMVIVKNWFVALLKAGQEDGSFYYRGNPENKAAVIVSALAGGLQHARLIGNEHYHAIVAQLKLELTA